MQKIALLVAVLAVVAIEPAWAHVDLDWPAMAPPVGGATQKDEPCGGADPAAEVFYFRPGQTITVRYTETIRHPGHFRVAFASAEVDFVSPTTCGDVVAPGTVVGNMTVLADGEHLAESDNDAVMGCDGRVGTRTPVSNVSYTSSITLPDVECEDCRLQLIQFMTDKPPLGDGGGNDLYFRCARVTLTTDPGIEPSVDPGIGGGDPDAGVGDGDAGTDDGDAGTGGGGGGAGNGNVSGGCRVGSGSGSGGWLILMLGAITFVARRRRR